MLFAFFAGGFAGCCSSCCGDGSLFCFLLLKRCERLAFCFADALSLCKCRSDGISYKPISPSTAFLAAILTTSAASEVDDYIVIHFGLLASVYICSLATYFLSEMVVAREGT